MSLRLSPRQQFVSLLAALACAGWTRTAAYSRRYLRFPLASAGCRCLTGLQLPARPSEHEGRPLTPHHGTCGSHAAGLLLIKDLGSPLHITQTQPCPNCPLQGLEGSHRHRQSAGAGRRRLTAAPSYAPARCEGSPAVLGTFRRDFAVC